MSNEENGGPAFPARDFYNDDVHIHHDGMSLRDYFAAKAMQGFMSARVNFSDKSIAANAAYEMADAMLEARES